VRVDVDDQAAIARESAYLAATQSRMRTVSCARRAALASDGSTLENRESTIKL
jgi:hypothetical protein